MSVKSILINDQINPSLIPIKAGSNITLKYETTGIKISSTGGGGGGNLDEVLTNGNDANNQAILNLSEINTTGPFELTCTDNLNINTDDNLIVNATNTTITNTGTLTNNTLGNVQITSTSGNINNNAININTTATGNIIINGDASSLIANKNATITSTTQDVNINALSDTINLNAVDCNFTLTGNLDINNVNNIIDSTGNTTITTNGDYICDTTTGSINMTSGVNTTFTSTFNTTIASGTNTFIDSDGAINMNALTNIIIGSTGNTHFEADSIDIEADKNIVIKSNNQLITVEALNNDINLNGKRLNATITNDTNINSGDAITIQTLNPNKNIVLQATGTIEIQGLNHDFYSTNTTDIRSDNNMLIKTNNPNTTQGNIDIDSFRLRVSNNFVSNVPAGQDQGYIRTQLGGSVVNYGIPYFNVSNGFQMSTSGLIWTNPPTNPANYSKYLYNNAGVLEWRVAGGSAPFNNASILAMNPTYFWDFTDETKYTGITLGVSADQTFTNIADLTTGKTLTDVISLRTNKLSNNGALRSCKYQNNGAIGISPTLAPQPANTNWTIFLAGWMCFTSLSSGTPTFISMNGITFWIRAFEANNYWDYKNFGVPSVWGNNGALLYNPPVPNTSLLNVFDNKFPFVFALQNSTTLNNSRVFCNGILCTTGVQALYPNPVTGPISFGNLDTTSSYDFSSFGYTNQTGGVTHLLQLTGADSTDDNRQKIESYLLRIITGSTANLSQDNPYKMYPP
jgi:uncharacterized protein (DUF2345 family)